MSDEKCLCGHDELKSRLLENVRVVESGCWEWQRARQKNGYGRMSWRNHVHRTHRLSAHLWHGLDLADPETLACHSCDNPPCINPAHIYVGTQKDNMGDMVARGRKRGGATFQDYCHRGHPLVPGNLIKAGPKRRCRECSIQNQRRAYVPTPRKVSASGFEGVYLQPSGRYTARIKGVGKRYVHLGTFDTIEEAVAARDSAMKAVGA